MSLLALWRLLRTIPAPVVDVVAEVVRAIATSSDPKAAAQRALAEALHEQATDQALRRMRPRVPR